MSDDRRRTPPFPGRERLVRVLDNDSAPRVIPFGEGYLYERLPPGTRVVSAPEPLRPLPDPGKAVRRALTHPENSDPLFARLRPGMKVLIAVDDLSGPLPPMRAPDARQIALQAILETMAACGVDDVEIVMAIALHRRMTDREIGHVVGRRIFDAYAPDRLYNLDTEGPDAMVHLGDTDAGEAVHVARVAVEADLVVYVSLTFAPMSGGHKSVTVGLTGYEGLRAHHRPDVVQNSMSYMDPPASELATRIDRMGRLVQQHVNVFHVAVTLNNRIFGPKLGFLVRDEDAWSNLDLLAFSGLRATLDRLPRAAKRAFFHKMRAPYGITSAQAGETEAVHRKTLDALHRQLLVPVHGQTDALLLGVTYLCPYNVDSIMNPLLVHCTALGYLFNLFRGRPLVREGGVIIVCHPLYDEFHPEHHAPYVEFFHRCLAETRDSHTLMQRYERRFATDPAYVQSFRDGYAYHGAHPFYMWYWGENGRQHAGKVIVVGAESRTAADILGWDVARSVPEALDMAASFLGRTPDLTYLKVPPMLLADVT